MLFLRGVSGTWKTSKTSNCMEQNPVHLHYPTTNGFPCFSRIFSLGRYPGQDGSPRWRTRATSCWRWPAPPTSSSTLSSTAPRCRGWSAATGSPTTPPTGRTPMSTTRTARSGWGPPGCPRTSRRRWRLPASRRRRPRGRWWARALTRRSRPWRITRTTKGVPDRHFPVLPWFNN